MRTIWGPLTAGLLATALLTGCGGRAAAPHPADSAAPPAQGTAATPAASPTPNPPASPAGPAAQGAAGSDAAKPPATGTAGTPAAPQPAPSTTGDATSVSAVAALQEQVAKLTQEKQDLLATKALLEKRVQTAQKGYTTSTLGQFQIQTAQNAELWSEHVYHLLVAGTVPADLLAAKVALQLDDDNHHPVVQASVDAAAGEWDVVRAWAHAHADIKQTGVLNVSDAALQVTYLQVTGDQWIELRWQQGRLTGLHINSAGPA